MTNIQSESLIIELLRILRHRQEDDNERNGRKILKDFYRNVEYGPE